MGFAAADVMQEFICDLCDGRLFSETDAWPQFVTVQQTLGR